MKKFYTLLAGAMLASSAFALTPAQHQFKNVDLSKLEFSKIERINPATVLSSEKNGMMKIQDFNGKQWACMINISGDFTAALGIPTFDDYPYYWMNISAQPMEENTGDIMQFIVAWPCKAAIINDENIFTETENGLVLNESVALKYFSSIEEARESASFDEVANAMGGKIDLMMLPGAYYQPSILSAAMTGGTITWKGTEYCPMSATADAQGKIVDTSNASVITWESFDEDTSDIAIDFDIPCTTFTTSATGAIVPGTSRVTTAAAQLSGPANVLGFSDIIWPTFQEVHIFNAGRMTWGVDEYTWSYITAFDPLNYYYLCFCDPTMTYMAQNSQTGEELKNFTENSVPVYQTQQGKALYGAPAAAIDPDYSFTYLKAALWAPENSETPYGLWSMATSDYEQNQTTGTITYKSPAKAYNLVQPLNCSAGEHDGFAGLYNGYTVNAVPEKSRIGIGDKNKGLNFQFAATSTHGYSFIGQFLGDIIYHPTPNKWVSEMTLLPAVGNESYDATSVKGIVSDAPVVSTSYYNFQGQRLASEPQQGLYIVRSVKADGTVVSKKVAK